MRLRIDLPAKVKKCAMCGKWATDSSGMWYIIKEHSSWYWLGDRVSLSVIKAHIMCSRHGAHDTNTVHVIDGN